MCLIPQYFRRGWGTEFSSLIPVSLLSVTLSHTPDLLSYQADSRFRERLLYRNN